jgi:hypothetical protein
VIFVIPALPGKARAGARKPCPIDGLPRGYRALSKRELATVFSNGRLRKAVTFREVVLPLRVLPELNAFVQRHYPEFFIAGKRLRPYFACPAIERLIYNAGCLYRRSEMLWIDYGETGEVHLTTPERRRVFAGPPRSGATVYRAPGLDDITFLVDFSVVAAAAAQAGLRVKFYGGQGELARRSGVRLDRKDRDLILRYRTVTWMLALVGVGPERAWRHTGLTWDRAARGGSLRADISRAATEFLGQRKSNFKLMILESDH